MPLIHHTTQRLIAANQVRRNTQ